MRTLIKLEEATAVTTVVNKIHGQSEGEQRPTWPHTITAELVYSFATWTEIIIEMSPNQENSPTSLETNLEHPSPGSIIFIISQTHPRLVLPEDRVRTLTVI